MIELVNEENVLEQLKQVEHNNEYAPRQLERLAASQLRRILNKLKKDEYISLLNQRIIYVGNYKKDKKEKKKYNTKKKKDTENEPQQQ